MIPCHHRLKAADVERVAACANRAWAEIGTRQLGAVVPSTSQQKNGSS